MNKTFSKSVFIMILGAMTGSHVLNAQVYTPGSVKLLATINDMSSSPGVSGDTAHYAVAWVTKADGTFIKTVWRQGSSTYTNSKWTNHCVTWTSARAGSTVTDGYTSATASNYTAAANNPVTVTWNCKDAAGATVPDGNYIFKVQYAEDGSEVNGPVTSALTWIKGTTSTSVSPANQGTAGTPAGGSNFTNMSIVWTPAAPEIAVEYPTGTNLVDGTASIPFGNINVGQSSSAFTFTVKNTGTAALTLTNPVTKDGTNASDFTVSSVTSSVAAAASTTFTVTFTPGGTGARTAAIHVASNDADESPFDITLTGTGVAAPEIAVEEPVGANLTDGTATVNYGSVNLGSNLSKTFTVKNTGTANLTSLVVTKNGTNAAEFTVSALGSTTVAAGGSTTFTVTFAPVTTVGSRTAAIHIASNDSDENPFDINLTGAGGAVPEIVVEQPAGSNLIDGSASVSCGSSNVGSSASAVTFTVRNSGTANLTGLAVTKDGANPAEFAVGALGATTLAAGASTTFTVTFAPGAGGARSAAIHIASNDSDENPFDIGLTGTGLVPEIVVEQPAASILTDASATIHLGTVNLSQSSPVFAFTVRNTGTAALTGLAVNKDGTHATEFTVGAPGATSLAPGASTTFNVTFSPTAVGARAAAIHIASNDSDENPFDINLTGTAENPIYTLGTVNLKSTLHDCTVIDYPAEPAANHIVVAWVTKADGTFIKTLWKQGPDDFTDTKYSDHFTTWINARAASTVIDGFTTATATSYSTPNNPLDLTWDCRDADNNPLPDGNYKFWIQYSERMNPGVEAPVSTLLWTKGATSFSSTYANSGNSASPAGGNNYTAQSVAWTPQATPGSVTLNATLHDLTATGYPLEPAASHISVAWVTKADGTFIKTLWKQGPDDLADSKYDEHFTTWNAARGANNTIDGFSGATAASYHAPDSPISLTWNCRDSSNNVVPDGNYKLWIQYLERMAPGVEAPVSSLLWTKGPITSANSYPNSGTVGAPEGGSNYTAQTVAWTPQATQGSVNVTATLHDFTFTDYPLENTGTHMTVAWVTKADGTFIKTLWKQGPVDFADQRLADHFRAWNAARNGSTVIDGYSGATATTYAAPDSPLDISWNCRDASNNLVPDGDYRFWIQYSERMVPGVDAPVTAMTWTKGPSAFSSTHADAGNRGTPAGGSNFTAQAVNWSLPSPFEGWIAGQVPVGQSGPLQTPYDDGVTNLEKFAFNMDASAPDVRVLTVGAGGSAGLPGGARVAGKLRIEFVRRKASTNPGISYTPQFGSGIGAWVDFTGSPASVTSIDSTWERVAVDDPVVGSSTRFGRVKVAQP